MADPPRDQQHFRRTAQELDGALRQLVELHEKLFGRFGPARPELDRHRRQVVQEK